MHYYLAKMLEIYEPDGVDWMNFAKTNSNKYTYHHILKREDGGKSKPSNGAILTNASHKLLHFLEYACPDAFYDYQDLFRRINSSNAPRTQEFIDEADLIMYGIFNGGYDFARRIDLDELYNSDLLRNYCGDIKMSQKVLLK